MRVPRFAQAAARPRLPGRPDIAGPGRPLSFLVVEDDPDLGEMLGELLRSQGHQVMVAPDGPGALECIARKVPDLVLADYNLPNGPTGLQVATAIRATVGTALPVIILTGDTTGATLRAVSRGDARC